MMPGELDIVRRPEDRIRPGERAALADLLERCFPGLFEGRIYFKQYSSFRYLAYLRGEVAGQVGVIDRVVRLGERPARIFGVVDLCVCERVRSNGIGGSLLTAIEEAARSAGAEFVLLFADDPRLYHCHGFRHASNRCTWLAIDGHKTLGVRTECLSDCLMVLKVGSSTWIDEDPLDLLGHVF